MPGSSTYKQRFLGTPKENKVGAPFKGKAHMLSVGLNYAGSDAPLNCTVDCNRLTEVASKHNVKDIVKIYDDGSTEKHPCTADLKQAMTEMASRCETGDVFVFQYSGHGENKKNEAEDSGYDSMLCLTTRDGEDESWLDDDLSAFIFDTFAPEVIIFMLNDACHSAGILDFTKKGKLEGRTVCCLSGCQDTQCSDDTGNGGQMTLALLTVLKKKATLKLRKARQASIQYIFNRMVDAMPKEEDEEGEVEDEEEWEDDLEYKDEECDEEDEAGEEEGVDEEPEPGQTINLSWIGPDPAKVAFPF